jgi:hypothetical protein
MVWNAIVRHAREGTERHFWFERTWALLGLAVATLSGLSPWQHGLGRMIVLAILVAGVVATAVQVMVPYRYREPPRP